MADDVRAPLEAALGHVFTNRALLETALIHASAAAERRFSASNEQLEFLGDAVLQFVVTDFLFARYGHLPEGRLTLARASVVSGRNLAAVARRIGLGPHIQLGRGASRADAQDQDRVLANVMEAVIAALYLDGQMKAARRFIEKYFCAGLEEALSSAPLQDAKTRLQEHLQRGGPVSIDYRVTGQQGAPHNRVFTVELWVDGRLLSTGQGRSKKEAQQAAAQAAWERLEG